MLPAGALYTRDARLLGFAVSNASVTDLAQAAAAINRLLSEGRAKARIGANFCLDDAARAHQAMESRAVRGRIVVTP